MSKTVSMPIIDDEKDDDGETLTLSDASGAGIADAAATGTIGDAEPALPGQSVSDVEASEEDDAALSFAVTLDPAATGRVTVDYATADWIATAGSDYTTTSGTLTFAAGERSKTVSVPITDDSLEDGGALTLRLSKAPLPAASVRTSGGASGGLCRGRP